MYFAVIEIGVDLDSNIFEDVGMKNTRKQAEAEYDRIIAALNTAVSTESGRNFLVVRKATGMSSSWLSAFADGSINDAGFKRLFVLAAWLRQNGYLDDAPSSAADSLAFRPAWQRMPISSEPSQAMPADGAGEVKCSDDGDKRRVLRRGVGQAFEQMGVGL